MTWRELQYFRLFHEMTYGSTGHGQGWCVGMPVVRLRCCQDASPTMTLHTLKTSWKLRAVSRWLKVTQIYKNTIKYIIIPTLSIYYQYILNTSQYINTFSNIWIHLTCSMSNVLNRECFITRCWQNHFQICREGPKISAIKRNQTATCIDILS